MSSFHSLIPSFLYPEWFFALLPILGLALWLLKRSKNAVLIAPHIAKALGLSSDQSSGLGIKVAATSCCIAVFALSGPSWQTVSVSGLQNASARVLVMDMSRSMYATDLAPNRLTQARFKATDLLNGWSEGYTGLVAYGGDAYTVSPLTSDTATILSILPNLSPDIMPFPGANAAKGVEQAISMLQNAQMGSGDIILIADDLDDREKLGIEELLSGTPWKLSILAIGTRSGAPIQLPDGKLLRDNAGNTVIAQSNFSNMQKLARATSGMFRAAVPDNSDVDAILARTMHLETNSNASADKTGDAMISDRLNNGFWFLPLLLIPALLMFRKGVLFTIGLLVLPFSVPNTSWANPWLTDDQQGYESFQSGNFNGAQQTFTSPAWKGAAAYQAQDYTAAIEWLSQAEGLENKYNLANAYAQSGQLDEAAALYQEILKDDPSFTNARRNLDIVEQAKQQQQQQNERSEQGEPQQNSDDNGSGSQNQQGEPGQKDQQSSEDSQNAEGTQSSNEANGSQSEGQEPQEQGANSDAAHDNSAQDPAGAQERDQQVQNNVNNAQRELDKRELDNNADSDSESDPLDSQPNAQPQAARMESEQSTEDGEREQETPVAAPLSPDNHQDVDPNLRRLEQVESARDPSRLLQAQLLLQAQQRPTPEDTGKQW